MYITVHLRTVHIMNEFMLFFKTIMFVSMFKELDIIYLYAQQDSYISCTDSSSHTAIIYNDGSKNQI